MGASLRRRPPLSCRTVRLVVGSATLTPPPFSPHSHQYPSAILKPLVAPPSAPAVTVNGHSAQQPQQPQQPRPLSVLFLTRSPRSDSEGTVHASPDRRTIDNEVDQRTSPLHVVQLYSSLAQLPSCQWQTPSPALFLLIRAQLPVLGVWNKRGGGGGEEIGWRWAMGDGRWMGCGYCSRRVSG